MRTLFVLHLLVSPQYIPADGLFDTQTFQATVNSFDRIAEYVPGSDVTQHSRLDLDQVRLMVMMLILSSLNSLGSKEFKRVVSARPDVLPGKTATRL